MSVAQGNILDIEGAPGRLSLRPALKLAGWNATVVTNWDHALRLIEREHYEVALLNIDRPGRKALEMCRKIRHRSRLITVMILTTVDDEVHRVEFLDAGADAVVRPDSVHELVARIRAVI